MNYAYFGAIHYEKYVKFISSNNFLSNVTLEKLHHWSEIERTQILQSLLLAVLKIPYAGNLISSNRSYLIEYEGNLW